MKSFHYSLPVANINLGLALVLILLGCGCMGLAHAQTTTVWSEDWEGAWTTNWGVDAGTWEVGNPTSGPKKACAGLKCAATVLAGNYSELVNSRLIREPFVVPAINENPRLRFWHWFSFSSDDRGYVEIKVGSGTWTKISEEFWNTGSGKWSIASIDLSNYSGKTVQIAFHFISEAKSLYDGTYTHVSSGWYIDDIVLITGPIIFKNPEDFEYGAGEWYVDKGTWEIGKPATGPSAAFSGIKCAATVLDGDYDDLVDSRLISPFIEVPAANLNPRLRFWHWFSFSSDDYGYVEIKSTESSWTTLSPQYWNTGSRRWTYASIDLSQYAGKKIKIAFHFVSQSQSLYNGTYWHVSSGWYIDEVSLVSGPIVFNNPEGWENGINDWAAEKGTWQLGKPTVGPTNAHTGTNCAGTVLDGEYDDYVDSRLISPPFLVPDSTRNPRLRFWHWYNFSSDDEGQVEIKTKTQDWQKILGPYANNSSNTWTTPPSYDLSKFAGSYIQVGFRFISRANSLYNGTYWHVSSGWYIDDFEVIFISGADQTNPICNSIKVDRNPTDGANTVTLTGFISDINRGDSRIDGAEYFIDKVGYSGNGIAMTALDGYFSSSSEPVTATILVNTIGTTNSSHKIYVHGKDAAGNWSNIDSVTVQITSLPTSQNLSIPDTTALKGSTITIPLRIKDAAGIAGAELKLTYNKNILKAKAVNLTSLTSGFTKRDSISAGKCAITLARATGLSAGGGVFLNIDFEVLATAADNDTTTITFATARFYNESTALINVSTRNGKFTVKPNTSILAQLFVLPASDTLAVNGPLQLNATGKDSKGVVMPVKPGWKVTSLFGNIGTINADSSATKTFTASGPGDGLIIAGQSGKLDSAIIVVGKTRGDVNLDGGDKVNVQDAILGLQIIVSKFIPHRYQLWAADYDGSGKVDENDARRILNVAVGNLLPKLLAYTGTAQVYVGKMEARDDGLICFPVLVKERPDAAAGGLEVSYDHEKLIFITASSGRSSTFIASHVNAPGLIKVSCIDEKSLLDNQGIWLNLVFRPRTSDEISQPGIEQVRLYSTAFQTIATDVATHEVNVTVLPQRYELYQNHPNPFNPSTSIRFDLAAPASVELEVFNTSGQQIRALVSSSLAAGAHIAPWDGRDDAGYVVPAGIYFYRLNIDHGRWCKMNKMILVK